MSNGWLDFSCSFQFFCVKIESGVVKLLKPKLYKRCANDIYSKWIKNQPNKLFEKFNNYHLKTKLTIEVNPSKILKMVSLKHLL